MNYLKNHCWCSSSHWDNKMFDCKIIVSMSSYKEENKVDWEKLTHKVKLYSQEKFDDHLRFINRMHDKYPEEYDDKYLEKAKTDKSNSTRETSVLKPEVMKWLTDNVPDFNGEKGWCVGNSDYLVSDGSGMSIFFQLRRDAMLFIKTWSKWKKPIYYTQYFSDVRKKLNLVTLKYEMR